MSVMRYFLFSFSSLLTFLFILAAGCSPPPNSLEVQDAWARPPAGVSQAAHQHHETRSPGHRTAVYMKIKNNSGRPDQLIGAFTPSADTVEIHWSWIDDQGIMRMRPAQTLQIKPAQTLAFEPGGYHLMLIGADPMQEGDSLRLSLEFEFTGTLETDVVIGHMDR